MKTKKLSERFKGLSADESALECVRQKRGALRAAFEYTNVAMVTVRHKLTEQIEQCWEESNALVKKIARDKYKDAHNGIVSKWTGIANTATQELAEAQESAARENVELPPEHVKPITDSLQLINSFVKDLNELK
jgi:hypothetical protein